MGLLGPRSIFIVYFLNGRYNVLGVVTALACDHRYGLIFSLIVFLHLKVDYARIVQWEKIKP